ncbi:rRNA (cytosine-C(5))-methyltransferase NOP2C isoform X1 [Apium graveolens]|uniref:rRNA (cytosine-C(5))-methyltransferase NOP2C isoform X1 n=1 Tax=Apium graveolens TaxID=4045 RepID=UPI003D7BDE1B
MKKLTHSFFNFCKTSFFSTTTTRQMNQPERYTFNPTLHWNPEVQNYLVNAYGAQHFARISKALTQPSCYSCIRVNTLKTTSDAVIEKLSKILEETGVPNDVETHQSNNDLLMANGQVGPISKCQLPGLDYVLFVRGSGPHAISYEFTQDRPLKEVLVSRKCAEAVLRGAQVFVPGVLACSAHVEEGDVVAVSVAVEQSISEGKWGTGITRGTVLQGLQTDPYYIERNGLYIGQGKTMLSRAGIFRAAQGVAVDMTDRVYRLHSFNDVLEGEIFLQNFPSIITAHALDPQQGERILDMCAAPGGKTTAIAILMKDKGEIVAADRSHNKVLDIQKLAAEMGVHCITTYKLDATKSVCPKAESIDMVAPCSKEDTCLNIQNSESESLKTKVCEQAKNGVYTSKAEQRKIDRKLKNGSGRKCLGDRVEKSKGFAPDSFDRVLLDAPCSALGLRPRLSSGEETVESMRKHATYQRRMFDQAVQLVRSGGVIVYSTCTINPGENEAVVRYALDTYKFLSLASQHPKIGGPGLVGRCVSSDGYAEEWLRPGEEDLVQRFDPSSSLDTIGFFIAKFNVGPKHC